MTTYRDDEWYQLGGRRVRLIAPRERQAVTEVNRRDIGSCLRITLQEGDASKNDSPPGRAKRDIPHRAMFAAEGYGDESFRGVRLTQEATFLWDRFPQLIPNIFYVVAQWNVAPQSEGTRWGPPPFELDIARVGKGTRFRLKLNRPPESKDRRPYWECQSEELREGVPYSCNLVFVDGRGGDGHAEFRLGTRGANGSKTLVGRYDGPCGRPGCSVPYPAVGAYRHPGTRGADEMFVKDWRIAPPD